MRILAITNLYPPDVVGGWELGCQQMVEELTRRGHEVRVLTSTLRQPNLEDSGPARRVLRVEEVWERLLVQRDWTALRVRSLLVDFHNLELLHQELDAFQPDVAYLWNLQGLGAASIALAVELSGTPWVAHLMDKLPVDVAAVGGAHARQLAETLHRRLDGYWVLCSQGLLDEIERDAAPLRGHVEVIPNWIVGQRPSLRDDWFAPGRELRCVYTGQLVEHKGVGILIEAVARLRDEGFDLTVDAWGDGPDRTRYETRLRQLGMDAFIRLRGAAEHAHVLRRLPSYDVLIFPTWQREPFAFSPLEAAACGCVPLVSEGCGNTEWLVEGVHQLSAPRTVAGFASRLRAVLTGEIRLDEVGRRGQAVTRDEFHIERISPRVEAVLEAAQASAPRPVVPWEHIKSMARIGELLADHVLRG
jgi:glycogen synthase